MMKPNFELTVKMYDVGIEFRADGKLSGTDRVVLFDQLANHLLNQSERTLVGRVISQGGMEKMVGESYATTYKIDPNFIKAAKKFKEGKQNDSN